MMLRTIPLSRNTPSKQSSETILSSQIPLREHHFELHPKSFSLHATPKKEKTRNSSNLHIVHIHLPSKKIYKKIEDSMIEHRLSWIRELYQLLVCINNSRTPQVNFVVADEKAIELLLNWLIMALVRLTEPLQNVVVLGLDVQVCDLLHPRNISCIYIDPESIIRPSIEIKSFFSRRYLASQIRLLVSRLVNYWGYSLATYDTDALIMKNPQALYDAHQEVTVIAGAANVGPTWAVKKWGFAVCPGAILIRSGSATGCICMYIA